MTANVCNIVIKRLNLSNLDRKNHTRWSTSSFSTRLFFNYLRISPSYALASSDTAPKRITRATPEHSKKVIRTVRNMGDVYTQSFDAWLGARPKLSGNTTPRVQALILSKNNQVAAPADCIVVSVPKQISIQAQITQFSQLMLELSPSLPAPQRVGFRDKTLLQALCVVYTRAQYPSAELWRIGALTNVVERYRDQINPWGSKKLASQAHMRRHLTLIVIRKLLFALLVAENAAAGHFPLAKRESWHQLEFPFMENQLYKLLSASGDEEQNYLARSLECLQARPTQPLLEAYRH